MKTDRPFFTLATVVLAAMICLLAPQPARAAVGFVQAVGSTDDTPASTIAQAFSAANIGGNLIVVAVSWGDNPAPSIHAADTLGNTYLVATNDFDSTNRQGLAILYAPNIRAGANTVTVTLGTTGGYRRVIVSEYSGAATTAPLDVTAKSQAIATTASNAVTSTAGTTTASGDLIFGVVMDDSGGFGTITAGTGFTRRASLNGMDIATEDTVQATAGSIAATFTFSRADTYLAQMAAFKAASTGGGGNPVVASLACNPTSLNPGGSTTCSVTLDQAAPAGGSTVTLASSNTTVLPVPASATVPPNATSTTFTATAGAVTSPQAVTLTATLGGSTTATVTVAPVPTLTSLAVTPANPSIGVGGTQPFAATGTFSDGSSQNLTASVTWASSNTGVATISNTSGSQGRATAVATGSTTISATSGSISGSTVLTVTSGGGGGLITFIQAAAVSDDSAAGAIAQAFSAANTAGNLIVVAVSWGDNPAPSIHAADTLGNSYLVATNDFDSTNRQGLAILYAPNIRAGANTVTVTFGTTGGYRRVIVSEYSGIATTAPLDATAKNQATSTTAVNGATSTAATTTASGDLIFGVTMDDSGNFGTITAGTGFTRRATLNGMDIATEDSIQAAAGSIAATFTFGRADKYLAQMAAFRAASTSGGAPSVASLVCNPISLSSGGTSSCTVTLNQAAPTGGSTVTLGSNNTTALSVPASVTVPQTMTEATFTATAGTVTASQTVTLTATLGGSTTATVTVAPNPVVSSLGCNPTSLNPGGVTTCTVTLTQPAPTGGSTVTLGSNNAALPVPASVVVPQTMTSATFTATAGTVTTSQTVTVTATLGGSTTATVTLTPSVGGGLAVSSIGCNPTSVTSGGSTTCTVTLNQVAPTGGATVTLGSDNTTALTVPASVTVAQSASSATFTATAGTVTTSQTVTVTATLNGSTTTTVTVTPSGPRVGSLVCDPESVAIGITTTCTVTLNSPAPSGGSTVTLGSSNATALPVPASITVPAATNHTTFTATAGTVTTIQTVTLTATLGVSTTETVTVTPTPTLMSLAVTPGNSSIPNGGTQQFIATGSFNDGTFQNVTTSVTWSSSATGVATISNTAGTKGLATAVGTGSTTITAASGSISGSTSMTVTPGGGGGAGITFIQAAGSTNDASAGTISQAFASNNLGGDLIVVAVTWADNPAPNIHATDGQGNTYAVATNDYDPSARQGLAILYAANIRAGINTVTVTFGVNGGYRRIIVAEYSGVSTTSPLDVSAKNRATATKTANAVTSTAATTTSSGDLIFGVAMDDSGSFGTITAGTGFALRTSLNGMDIAIEDAIQGTAGPVAATFTFSLADVYMAQMAAFRPATGGGGGAPTISAIACSPASITSGTTTACTVSLTQVAPSGGAAVTVSSSNTTALPVPTSVTVPANSASATFNATAGSVSSIQTATVTASLGGTFANTNVTVASSQAQLKGAWAGPFTWPIVAIHMALLPNGKVLAWDLVENIVQVWDPATNTFNDVTDNTVSFNYFCAGQTALGDGRILVDGGHIDYDIGVKQVHAFDPVTQTWSALAQMASERWYPTVITLGDGRVLAVAGHTTCPTCVASTPEVYNPTTNTWTRLTGAASSSPTQYPHMFVLPDGRAIQAGSSEEVVATRVIDVANNSITTVDPNPREGGSSVMYSPGKIMKAGSAWDDGQANVGRTTYVLDMTQANPAWRQTASMGFDRVTHNLTILADGTVLVTGGSSNPNVSDPASAVYAGEIWSPTTETWSTMATMQVGRVYHSTAILLPDGRVLSAGSGRFGGTGPGADQLNAEIFSPPYLFNGTRPTITSAPTSITYGSTFPVSTPDAAQITKVSLIRLGTVTHHFNGGQRYVPLSFQQIAGGLTVTAPANGNLAPPGYYMLFILNANGVPSIAPLIQVH